MTNKEQDNFDQIHAGNMVNRSAVRNYYHKTILNNSGSKASEKFNNLPRPLFAPQVNLLYLVTRGMAGQCDLTTGWRLCIIHIKQLLYHTHNPHASVGPFRFCKLIHTKCRISLDKYDFVALAFACSPPCYTVWVCCSFKQHCRYGMYGKNWPEAEFMNRQFRWGSWV